MRNEPPMAICERDARAMIDTGTVCWPCAYEGVRNLDTIALWSGELETTLTRQDRIRPTEGYSAGHRSDETPLPVNPHAANIHTGLRRVLGTWSRRATVMLGLDRGTAPAGPLCHNAVTTWCVHPSCRAIVLDPGKAAPTIRDMARLLADNMAWMRRQDGAAHALDVIARAAASITPAVDLPPVLRALGRCDTCETELRAPVDAVTVICECGVAYDVERRRDALYARVDTIRHTAPVLARVLTDLMSGGDPKLALHPDTIGTWARRGRLTRRGSDPRTRDPRYRFGDVRALYTQLITRKLKTRANTEQKETAS